MDCCLTEEKVRELVSEFGSPLYLFHRDKFVENYRHLLSAFQSIYPKYNIAYSYKTNYTPYICRLVKESGGVAEVVSDMEYRVAKKIGYDNKDIIYNGPIKGDGLYEHLLCGGVANIDNLNELLDIIEFADIHREKKIKVAFRCNIDIGQGFISRFGLDAYTGTHIDSELEQAYALIKKIPNIKVVGIHCHVGRSRNLEAWKNRVDIIFKLVDKYFDEVPEFIDLGSGMNSVMEDSLAVQFGEHIPTYEEYAAIVATAMKERYGSLETDKQPCLYTEPGTTLISGYMSFLATVKSVKNVKGKAFVTFDCSGGQLGDICHLKKLPITVYGTGGQAYDCNNADFVGYTCLEHDDLYQGFSGKIAVGDIVQFRNIGSYSNVFKPPFIYPNCAMAVVQNNGEAKLIKRRETFDDIFSSYMF